MAKESETKCNFATFHMKNHSHTVKTSCYSEVTPKSKHRQTDLNREESIEKKLKTKIVEKVTKHTSSPTSIRQGMSPKQRFSPSKEGSPSSSPILGTFYAGAKFSEPPSPTTLPKPPSHWTATFCMSSGGVFPFIIGERVDKCHDISSHLKMLLNVQA